jgi:hypothetical protein
MKGLIKALKGLISALKGLLSALNGLIRLFDPYEGFTRRFMPL